MTLALTLCLIILVIFSIILEFTIRSTNAKAKLRSPHREQVSFLSHHLYGSVQYEYRVYPRK